MKPPDASAPKIEYQPIDTVKVNPHNAKTRSKQIREIAANIKGVGPAAPTLVNQKNVILVGHARVEGSEAAGSCRRFP